MFFTPRILGTVWASCVAVRASNYHKKNLLDTIFSFSSEGQILMQWIEGEPADLTDDELLSVPRETTQDSGMIVTDIADVPDDEACPMCGVNALYERHCEIICGNCRCLVAACSE